MKERKDAVLLIQKQLNNETDAYKKKDTLWHYGRQELRELMDFIYGTEPLIDEEKINR